LINRLYEIENDVALGAKNNSLLNYNNMKLGTRVIEDANLQLGVYNKINSRLANRTEVLRAIDNYDLVKMREISDFFYKTSGLYARVLRYMAYMYRYDWFITPYINENKTKDTEKVLESFHQCLRFLDNFEIKQQFGEIALKVLRFGCYYGYKVQTADGLILQELPQNYCRSRLFQGLKPVVEFNMAFFDDKFANIEQRMKVLKMFPKEFAKGYALYKQNKLPPIFYGDTSGWYVLDPEMTVKFTANGEDYPMFISMIPLIIDLDEAQDLDKKKTLQKLVKLVVQKLPLDKNGDMIFDTEEIQQFHQNAVQQLSRVIGLNVLTTLADVSVEDVADDASVQNDDLARVERQVYNEAGISQLQFNTDGNIALQYSVTNDEATMYNFILQLQSFLNDIIKPFNKNPKKFYFKAQILTTTIYNYKDLAKLYKEQTQLGYSKMLPQIALGQSQSSILANAYFENDVLDLVMKFIPPLSSNVMNAEVLASHGYEMQSQGGNGGKGSSTGEKDPAAEKNAGRPEKPDEQKSTKTLQNKESQS